MRVRFQLRSIAKRQPHISKANTMTLCPIAIAVGCQKCPALSVCPLKNVIGDKPDAAAKPAAKPEPKSSK